MDKAAFEAAKTTEGSQSRRSHFLTTKYSFWQMAVFYCFLLAYTGACLLMRLGGFQLRKILMDIGGWLFYYLLREKRRRAMVNLDIAFGDKKTAVERDTIVRGMFRHTVRLSIDTLFGHIFFPPAKMSDIPIDHPEYKDEALAHGAGVCGVTGHLGNWEIFGAVMIAKGLPVAPIFKRFNSPIVGLLFGQKRLTYGYDLIEVPKAVKETRDGKKVVVQERRSLGGEIRSFLHNRKGCVAFLIDQHARGENRVDVPFFGKPAPTFMGVVKYAMEFKSPCVVATCVYEGDSFRILLEPPVMIEPKGTLEETARAYLTTFTSQYEKWIRAYPEQWIWMHRRYHRAQYDKSE